MSNIFIENSSWLENIQIKLLNEPKYSTATQVQAKFDHILKLDIIDEPSLKTPLSAPWSPKHEVRILGVT